MDSFIHMHCKSCSQFHERGSFLTKFSKICRKKKKSVANGFEQRVVFVADETQQYVTNNFIDWKFNVPSTPWM